MDYSNQDNAGIMRRTPAMREVEEMFFTHTSMALKSAGYTALEFLAANPGLSPTDLARRLNRGASGLGLVIALYREAEAKGCVRATAKRLLVGEIRNRFPNGWYSADSVGPAVTIGGWRFEMRNYASDPRFGDYASSIVRELAIDHPPPDGWKPDLENDQFINALFDRFWPPGTEERPQPGAVTSVEEWRPQQHPSWFDHKSMLMEKSLGKEHDKVLHALLPYSLGGALDLYYYANGVPGTAIATKELSPAANEGPSNDVYRSYELVMFTRHRLNLDEAEDERTDFGRAHAAIRAILNDVARYSAQAKLNPNATGEVARDIERSRGGCVIFDGFACYSDDVVDGFGLLAVIRIPPSEMEYARRHGGGKLIQLLKVRGYYPYSDLDRDPVA